MNKEKILILKMLEEGKINTDEAIKLIEAVNNSYNHSNETKDANIITSIENVAEDIGKAAKSLIEGFKNLDLSFMEDINNKKNIKDTININLNTFKKPNINLYGVNGNIVVKKNKSIDNMIVKTNCFYNKDTLSEKQKGYNFIIDEFNETITIEPLDITGLSLSLDVIIPEKKWNKASIKTSNASINISNMDASNLIASTKNGRILVENIDSEQLNMTTTNSLIDTKNINSDNISMKTTNGRININNINSKQCFVSTTNSRIETDTLVSKTFNAKNTNGKIINYGINSKFIKLVTSNSDIYTKLDSNFPNSLYKLSNDTIDNITINMDNIKLIDSSHKNIQYSSDDYIDSSDDKRIFEAETTFGKIKLCSS